MHVAERGQDATDGTYGQYGTGRNGRNETDDTGEIEVRGDGTGETRQYEI